MSPFSRLPKWDLENGAKKRGHYLMLGNRIKQNVFTYKKMSKWSLAYLKEARRCIKKLSMLNLEKQNTKIQGVPVFRPPFRNCPSGISGTFSPVFRPYFLAPFSRHPSENVLISGTPILIFLCIFITASFPVSHTYFPPGEKNKKQPCRKIAQTVS